MDALTITDQKFPKQIFLGMPPHTFGSYFNGHFMVRLASISNFNFNFNFSWPQFQMEKVDENDAIFTFCQGEISPWILRYEFYPPAEVYSGTS